MQVVPADPAAIDAGPDARAETIAAIRADLGLDRPILVRICGIHLACPARRPGPLDHLEQDGDRRDRADDGADARTDVRGNAVRDPRRHGARHSCSRQARYAGRPFDHGGGCGRRIDACVLYWPDPHPVCRLQVGPAAVSRAGRSGLGGRITESDFACADPWQRPDPVRLRLTRTSVLEVLGADFVRTARQGTEGTHRDRASCAAKRAHSGCI